MDRQPGDVFEEAGLAESAGQDHHPGQQEDDVEVDAGERLFLVDDAEDDDQQATQESNERPIKALGRDEERRRRRRCRPPAGRPCQDIRRTRERVVKSVETLVARNHILGCTHDSEANAAMPARSCDG